MMTPEQKKIVIDNLKRCENVQQMFSYLANTFDLKNCEPGPFLKPQFIDGIVKGIEALKPELK